MTKDRFMKAYANLPEDVRREIIVVVDEKPYTWNSAYFEVKDDTPLGKQIIRKLISMELI
jgi:hypothetical protein